jgi:hypothetical protein
MIGRHGTLWEDSDEDWAVNAVCDGSCHFQGSSYDEPWCIQARQVC